VRDYFKVAEHNREVVYNQEVEMTTLGFQNRDPHNAFLVNMLVVGRRIDSSSFVPDDMTSVCARLFESETLCFPQEKRNDSNIHGGEEDED
jgi:hypothetical protein